MIAEIKFHPAKATLKWIVLQQICFSGTSELVTLQKDETHSSIAFYSFNTGAGSIERLDSKPIPTSTQFTMSTFVDDGIPHAFVQLSSGDIQSLTYNDERLQTCSLPFFMPWVDVASHAAGNFAVGLSHNGHLYANSRLLVKNCTSFLVTPAHLIFTTTSHLLKFVHLTNPQDLELPPDDPENDERCRSIERGARLITATPTSLSLVLQMPRGNLETIWPRA
ncbi:hypothetical protein DH86_00004415, partial [Scytalidium sp. 3C]